MLSFSALVMVIIIAMWIYAIRPKPQALDKKQVQKLRKYLIFGGGIMLPGISIIVLLAFGIPVGHRMLPLPIKGNPALQIDVIGHQWWWEIYYPDTGVRVVNELHLPVGRDIDIRATSHDVIHSFWVPRLGGKIDMIPGHINILRLKDNQSGYFRGQCAEFCGKYHARMVLAVHAQTSEKFTAWLKNAPKKNNAPVKIPKNDDVITSWPEISPNV
jgi:cytochrome c oxidase subunit 2